MSNKPKTIITPEGTFEVLDLKVGKLSDQDKKKRNAYPITLTFRRVPEANELITCPTGEKQ